MESIVEIQGKYAPLLVKTNNLIRQHILTLAPQSKKLDDILLTSRGKQLRPLFTYAVFDGFKSKSSCAAQLAAVFESIHVASLLHDDVIDDCRLRRNMPTMNDIYGSGVAILLGDLVFVAIYRLVAELDEMWLIKKVNDTIYSLIEGELLQQQRKFDSASTEDNYYDIITRKTAALLELCCYGAARFAGQDEKTALKLGEFGKHFGVIFQIVDDWADFCRNKMNDHKDRGVDIANGFLTLPWILLLDRCTVAEKQGLMAIIEAREAAGLDHPLLTELHEKYQLSELVFERLDEHYTLAGRILDDIPGCDNHELKLFMEFTMGEFARLQVQSG